jgi:hypothetical protein
MYTAIILTCEFCGRDHVLEREYEEGVIIHLICHDCETVLEVHLVVAQAAEIIEFGVA